MSGAVYWGMRAQQALDRHVATLLAMTKMSGRVMTKVGGLAMTKNARPRDDAFPVIASAARQSRCHAGLDPASMDCGSSPQ